MPNNCQPQGVTKTVINPPANDAGKYVIDFEIVEDGGIALASVLTIQLNDDVDRAEIDVVFNPAILRTRFDVVNVDVASSTAISLNFYTVNTPDHLADHATAEKVVVAIEANDPQLIDIRKFNDVVLFKDNNQCQKVGLYPAPEDGSTVDTPE